MAIAVLFNRALSTAACAEITVEVHLANGLPGFSIVGLADTEVRESREIRLKKNGIGANTPVPFFFSPILG